MLPGFSTATEVTDVSGRGVGMDVVKRTVDEIGGKISIKSKLGVGTTFSIIRVFSVSSGMLRINT